MVESLPGGVGRSREPRGGDTLRWEARGRALRAQEFPVISATKPRRAPAAARPRAGSGPDLPKSLSLELGCEHVEPCGRSDGVWA